MFFSASVPVLCFVLSAKGTLVCAEGFCVFSKKQLKEQTNKRKLQWEVPLLSSQYVLSVSFLLLVVQKYARVLSVVISFQTDAKVLSVEISFQTNARVHSISAFGSAPELFQ